MTDNERPTEGRFRKAYKSLKLKTEVDPIALLALVVSLPPFVGFLINLFSPEKLDFSLPEEATFFVEKYKIPSGDELDILRVALPLRFKNLHPSKTAIVDKISVTLDIGKNKRGLFYWDDFVHSEKDPKNPNDLKIISSKDASPFSVPPEGIASLEVSFSPVEGTPSLPLANAITKEEASSLINSGETPIMTISVVFNGKQQEFKIKPKNPLAISKYLGLKTWTVQAMEAFNQ